MRIPQRRCPHEEGACRSLLKPIKFQEVKMNYEIINTETWERGEL